MTLEYTPFAFPLITSAIVTMALAVYAWRHRQVPSAIPVAALLVQVTLWTVFYLLELSSTDLPSKLLWSKLEYLGIAAIPPTFLIFAIQYTRSVRELNRSQILLLSILPAATVLVAATNELHGWMWTQFELSGSLLQIQYGSYFWLHLSYSYLILAAGTLLLLARLARSPRLYRFQVAIIILGTLAPWGANILYILRVRILPGLDVTPFAFAISSVACVWGLFRYRFLNIVPVAHDTVISNMGDGMVILDAQDHVVEINPAAEHILCVQASQVIGEAAVDALGPQFEWTGRNPLKASSQHEITLNNGSEQRDYDVLVTALISRRGELTGRLIILRDVTRRKRMEAAEREQRVLAEALRDTAAILSGSLEVTEVLERILINVGRVVPHTAASIMLLGSGNEARVVRCNGYDTMGVEAFVKARRYKIDEMPNLRWMAETRQPFVIPETLDYEGWIHTPETAWIRSNLAAPICGKGKIMGFINLDSTIPGFFNAVHAERLQAFANQSAIAIENATLYREVQHMAATDELTSVFNRRRFFELGQCEVERSNRFGHPLAAVIMDVDHFKQINDSYGHTVGDQVLAALAKRCRQNLRNIDIVARYGGDEFIFLLLESDTQNATKGARRLLKAIASHPFPTEGGDIWLTVSLGVASIDADTRDLATLIRHADQALYLSKQNGRNAVNVWVQQMADTPLTLNYTDPSTQSKKLFGVTEPLWQSKRVSR